MKIKITVLTALLLCNLIACDTKKGGSSSNSQDTKISELKMEPVDQMEKPPPSPTTESQQFTSPVIKKDESGAIPVDKESTDKPHNTEDYDNIVENKFLAATKNPLSTFSIDVD